MCTYRARSTTPLFVWLNVCKVMCKRNKKERRGGKGAKGKGGRRKVGRGKEGEKKRK